MPASSAPAFHLEGLDTRYAIYIEPPANVTPGPDGWPVVLCLDGDDQFRFLQKARASLPSLPPLLLVGIGYGASYSRPGNRRSRDYTPVAIAEAPHAGGADAFLDLLIRQLWPELARRYPIHHDIRGIAGHSLGSLFALHALFKPVPFFNRVLASSPSVWWGDRAVIQQAAALPKLDAVPPAKVFLSVGLKDSASMTDDLALLEKQLTARPFPQLEVISERFPEHDHHTALAPGFTHGLAALFNGPDQK